MNQRFEETYWKIEDTLEAIFLADPVAKVCESVFGTKEVAYSLSELHDMLSGKYSKIWIVNAYSHHLVPRLTIHKDSSLGKNIFEVGPLADDFVPPGCEQLEHNIQEFLALEDDKPLCVGFGSMPFRHVGVILEAIKKLKTQFSSSL